MTVNLSISLVVYQSDRALLKETLQSLSQSILYAQKANQLAHCFLTIVDNHAGTNNDNAFKCFIKACWPNEFQLFKPENNLGYGLGHNLAIQSRCELFHLVINPDVIVDELAILNSIELMQNHADVGLLTPFSRQPNGKKEYLCKAYPTVFSLLLRGFAPQKIKDIFNTQLSIYELRSMPEEINKEVVLTGGCFMFFRGAALEEIQGFSSCYFLYFEDFDLSLRLKQTWRILYAPPVKVVHHGGHAAKKGKKHIKFFLHSAWVFFNRHGWKLY